MRDDPERANAKLIAVALAVVLFAASIWLFYPGLVSYDSILQFREAQSGRFTTTHPPLMAATWRLLLAAGGGALPMLVLEQLLYWSSFLVLALYCTRASRNRWAPFAVLAGLCPLLLNFSGVIWKDVLLATSWALASVLLLMARRFAHRPARFWAASVLSVLLLLFGAAMRHNAAPAAIVLGIALAAILPARRILRAAAATVLAGAILVAVPVSTQLLQAADSRPIDNLISWDLTGISYFSGRDYRVSPSAPAAAGPSCYSPRLFDACPMIEFRSTGDARSRWVRAITAEPLAYAKHRALVFSVLLRFGCVKCRPYIWESGNRTGGQQLGYRTNVVRSLLGYIARAIGHTPLGRPYLWLAASIGLAGLLWNRRGEGDSRALALISLSGAVYTFTFLPGAVTDEFRYIYWLIFSVVLVGTACLCTRKLSRRDMLRWLVAPAVLLVALDTTVELVAPTDAIAPSMATNY